MAAYPLHIHLNSGYTVFSYLALAMFSYYFITPVFKRESRILFLSGIIASAVIFVYFVYHAVTSGTDVYFSSDLHVYIAKPAPHRKIILFILLFLTAVTAKNFIYKIAVLKGKERYFVINISIALLTGVVLVIGLDLAQHYIEIDPNIQDTINTYIAGLLFIYFYLSYLSYSRLPFLYSDKTMLLILFIIIIISSITTTLTFIRYENAYFRNIHNTLNRVVADTRYYVDDPHALQKRLIILYGDKFEYITLVNISSGEMTPLLGEPDEISKFISEKTESPKHTKHPAVHADHEKLYYSFTTEAGDKIIHAGIPYFQYRNYVHNFVMAAFLTVLSIIAILFVFMRFVIFIGLTKPLQQLYDGVKEIDRGNLDHRIDLQVQDEIGFISMKLNRMAENLRISNDAISISEKKYRELTDMLPDIVYETDLDLNITYFNKAGFRITGFSEEDIKHELALSEFIDKEECQRLRGMLETEDQDDFPIITTHQIKTKNGDTIYGENNAAVIYEDGKPSGLRGVIRDVTEKIYTENALVQAQKMETIGTLAGGIAHDFNNILTGITGTLSLLEFKMKKNGALTSEELESDLNILKKSATRAGGIIKQLLSLSLRRKTAFEQLDLNAVAGDVYEICANSFDKKIKLNFTYQDGGAYIMADETQMGQMLLNLCVNARDAMTIMRAEGSDRSGEISVSVEKLTPDRINPSKKILRMQDRDYCRLRVKDTGVGIDPETIPYIFDPFYTTKLRQEGSGLGLSMVFNIVKVHEGFIDVNPNNPSGTIFDIYIPADSSASREKPDKQENFSPDLFSAGFLIIDDDSTVLKTCSKMLESLGCSVLKAADGYEGLNIYREKKDEIDVVILDFIMPGMSGNEVFDELKKINPEIRVLVSSGFRDDPRIDRMLKNGAAGFIQKPYTLQTLYKEISLIINKKNS